MAEAFGAGLRALVVDDEADVRDVVTILLKESGFDVASAGDVAGARRRRLEGPVDLLVADKNLPDGTGLDIARDVRSERADCEVVIMTAFANLESAVESLQLDVADYLVKPFDNLDSVVARIRKVVELQRYKRRTVQLMEELKEKNRLLEDMVVRDSLTRLYNHAYLQEFIERECLRARRHNYEFGLILLDIDNFKQVNDTLGHPVGDRVVKAFAEMLNRETRRTDVAVRLGGEDDGKRDELAARYGGDEFAVVLPVTGKMGTIAKAEMLRSHVEQMDFPKLGLPKMTCSVGVASFPADAADRPTLLSHADSGLYASKQAGENVMIAYSPAMAAAGVQHLREVEQEASWRVALDRSIANRSFKYAYQPIVKAADGSVFAYEALCRPRDASFESPVEMLHAAERAGRIAELGRTLRELAVEPIGKLTKGHLLFVNLHPLELTQDLLAGEEEVILKHARRIVLEITETAALKDFDRLKKLRTRLKKQGFRLAVDDLGAGYSGLHSLALLEPDFVKLDMSLLRGIEAKTRPARLIRHIIDFANGEGMQVVAEGIETREERKVVTDLGVHLLQGYYFAKPAPPFVKVEVREKESKTRPRPARTAGPR